MALSLHDSTGGITRLVARGDAPVLSPDGTRFVSTVSRDGKRSFFERSVGGSGQERRVVEAVGSAFANDWSSDGRYVIYTDRKRDGSTLELDLWTIRMDHTAATPTPYLTGPTRDNQAEFSPDGRFVAYTSVGTGDPEIYVQPFPNAADGKWLISTKGGVEPHWSRDGKELYYWEGQTLMAVAVRLTPTFSAGTPTRLFDAPAQPWYINDSDRTQVSPDGRFLFLVPDGQNSIPPIDIVVNWTMPQ
jgi:Tol biopolymer transport system component